MYNLAKTCERTDGSEASVGRKVLGADHPLLVLQLKACPGELLRGKSGALFTLQNGSHVLGKVASGHLPLLFHFLDKCVDFRPLLNSGHIKKLSDVFTIRTRRTFTNLNSQRFVPPLARRLRLPLTGAQTFCDRQ